MEITFLYSLLATKKLQPSKGTSCFSLSTLPVGVGPVVATCFLDSPGCPQATADGESIALAYRVCVCFSD